MVRYYENGMKFLTGQNGFPIKARQDCLLSNLLVDLPATTPYQAQDNEVRLCLLKLTTSLKQQHSVLCLGVRNVATYDNDIEVRWDNRPRPPNSEHLPSPLELLHGLP